MSLREKKYFKDNKFNRIRNDPVIIFFYLSRLPGESNVKFYWSIPTKVLEGDNAPAHTVRYPFAPVARDLKTDLLLLLLKSSLPNEVSKFPGQRKLFFCLPVSVFTEFPIDLRALITIG